MTRGAGGESQGWRSLVGFCLWCCTESDTTEATQQQQQQQEEEELVQRKEMSSQLVDSVCNFLIQKGEKGDEENFLQDNRLQVNIIFKDNFFLREKNFIYLRTSYCAQLFIYFEPLKSLLIYIREEYLNACVV